MDIIIQGTKLDYTLENENNVLDVVQSIEQWLGENQQIISELKVDGELIHSTEKDILKNHLIENTKLVEIESHFTEEYAISSLLELEKYIKRFVTQLEENKSNDKLPENKEELYEGLKWINDILVNVCRILRVDMNTVYVNTNPLFDCFGQNAIIMNDLEVYKHDPNVYKDLLFNKLIPNLDNLGVYIPKILQTGLFNLSTPDDFDQENVIANINSQIETIDVFLPLIPEIGTNLQSGKELEAFNGMKNVIGMMENIVYYLSKLEGLYKLDYSAIEIDGQKVEKINEDFFNLLKEVSQAFTQNDIVLLGDLLEYELIGKLEIYHRIFKDLIVIIEKKSYN